ncbi:MAG: o-succinylbenzoate synthase [Flavobacteriales bacterium]|nr:o-succinylbenzoate synthase [Flavobacteriales bacterium]
MRDYRLIKHTLNFKSPGGTSRGILRTKPAWLIKFTENQKTGFGEVSLLPKLSLDDRKDFEKQLITCLDTWKDYQSLDLEIWPSIRFAFEVGLLSLEKEDPFVLFDSPFSLENRGIEINGLVWMGSKAEMKLRIKKKLEQGFKCIKLKIGAINFEDELGLIRAIRQEYSADDIELRVDANGAFSPVEALEKLERLAQLDLHSIEQPIRQKQWEEMAFLCEKTPLDIALDEELIGITSQAEMENMLNTIHPQAIVLKPGLLGGFTISSSWINTANSIGAYWWITSALESNIGLNAIAQYAATFQNELPQGLGTGQLYINNIPSPLEIRGKELFYDSDSNWILPSDL